MAKSRRKGGKPADKGPDKVPAARVVPPTRPIAPIQRRRGQIEIAIGGALLLAGSVLAVMSDDQALTVGRFVVVFALALAGAHGLASGAVRLDRRPDAPVLADQRRWIYGGLAGLFAVIYAVCMWKVIPNRLPSAMMHLATIPVFTLMMAIGTLVGGRFGWWQAVIGGSVVLLSTILLIARILASAVFLAGVYGAFGKAASTFALVSVALLVEVVGLLPVCQVRFLMSRPGRRAYGV